MVVTGSLLRGRNGQATIIGMVFFLILLTVGFSVVFLVINNLNEYNKAVQEVTEAELSRVQEDVRITRAYLNAQKRLVLNMTNQGTGMAHLTKLWIINQTDNDHRSYDFNNLYLAPGESVGNITRVSLATGKNYAIRVVTERGNIVSCNLVPRVTARLHIHVSSLVLQGNNVTASLFITNNDTSNNYLYDLVPVLTTSTGATRVRGPTPASLALLPPDQTAVFTYTFYINATRGTLITFNGSFVGAPKGNYVTASVPVEVVQYAEQSGTSVVAGGLSGGIPATDGTLYFHRTSYVNGKVMDPSSPILTDNYYVTVSSGNPVMFYTVNDTRTRTIPAGGWRLSIYYQIWHSWRSSTANVKYQIVSLDGQTVYSTLLDTNWYLPATSYNIVSITRTDNLGAVTLNSNQRLRCTISWVSDYSFRLYFDTQSYPSYLRTPVPSATFPVYFKFEGGDYYIYVRNQGNLPFWVNYATKATWRNVATNMSYASFVLGFMDASYPTEQTIDRDRDSNVIMPNATISLHFQQPRSIPSRSGDTGVAISSGTYDLSVHIEGYDALGYFVTRVIYIGRVTW
ncbi:MAG: hypothetical protein QXJ75_05185 [Candidatus Bathyarchaeia archaeon]